MCLVGNGTNASARATVSGLFNAGQFVAHSIWAKRISSSNNAVSTLSAGSSLPQLGFFSTSTPAYRSDVDGTLTTNGANTNDLWVHLGVVFGPWGASQPFRNYYNGALVTSTTLSPSSSTADITRITLLGNKSGTAGQLWNGRVAEALVHPVADAAAADALMALCFARVVTAAALEFTPAWSRRLLDDFTTGHGAGDPTGGGSYSFDSDHPSLLEAPPGAASSRRRARVT